METHCLSGQRWITGRRTGVCAESAGADRRKLAAFYDSPTGFRHGPKSLVDNETLVVVFVSSHPYTRQYDLDLLAELRRDRQAMRVVAIAAETDPVIEAGPHILLPPSRSFNDMEQAFCFLMYAGLRTDPVSARWQYARYAIRQRYG